MSRHFRQRQLGSMAFSARLPGRKIPLFHRRYGNGQPIFAFILIGTVPFLCEPSRWFLKHVREEEALYVLCSLRSTKDAPHSLASKVKDQSGDIIGTLDQEQP